MVEIGGLDPALASQSKWIAEEIFAQILHTIDSSESSEVQSKEPRSKS